jgi:hypothetical protein
MNTTLSSFPALPHAAESSLASRPMPCTWFCTLISKARVPGTGLRGLPVYTTTCSNRSGWAA